MKKPTRLLVLVPALLLILALCLSLLPMTAFAAIGDWPQVWVGGIRMETGKYLPSGNNPTTGSLTATKPTSGGWAYLSEDGKTLTLNDYRYTGIGYHTSTLNSSAIRITNICSNLVVKGYSKIVGEGYGFNSDLSLNISGGGELIVTGEQDDGLYCSFLEITDCTVRATGGGCGIWTLDTEITDSTVTATGDTCGMDSRDITIAKSTVTVEGAESGFDCGGDLAIKDSSVTATSSAGYGIVCDDSLGSPITIVSSTVTAKGSMLGMYSTDDINIEDSTVTTSDGTFGIYSKKNIYIANSTVDAESSLCGLCSVGAVIDIANSHVTATGDQFAFNPAPTLSAFNTWRITAGTSASTARVVSSYNRQKYASFEPISSRYSNLRIGGLQMAAGGYLPMGDNPTIFSLTETKPSGGYAYLSEDGRTLTLSNFHGSNYQDFVISRSSAVPLEILLKGENSLQGIDGIRAGGDLTISGGALTVTTGGRYGISSYGRLSITDCTLSVFAAEAGIRGDQSITIDNSEVSARSDIYGIQCGGSLQLTLSDVTAFGYTRAVTQAPTLSGIYRVTAGVDAENAAVVLSYTDQRYARFEPLNIELWVGGVQMAKGYYLPSGNNPTAGSLTTSKPSGGYAYLYPDGTTLVLDNYSYSGAGYVNDANSAISYTGLETMNILVQGTSSVRGSGRGLSAKYGDLKISGSGTLHATGVISHGIYARDVISIRDSTVTATGGNYGIRADRLISLTDCTVTAAGEAAAISDNVLLNGEYVITAGDSEASASVGSTYADQKYAKFETLSANLWIGGVRMKKGYYLPSGNNPTASSLTTSKPSGGYAHLSGDGMTLTLNNYSYTGGGQADGTNYAIRSTQGGTLHLVVQGDNSIQNAGGCITVIDGLLEITGGGKLTAVGSAATGIYGSTGVNITGSTVEAAGKLYGITSNASVNITNSTVRAMGDEYDGIVSYGVNIKDSDVTVGGMSGYGILVEENEDHIVFSGSNVTATGGKAALNKAPILNGDYTVTAGDRSKNAVVVSSYTNEKYASFTCAGGGVPDPVPGPDPVSNPFTDVKETDYFYAPVLWAVEKGVTSGTSPTTFEPDAYCTRAQAVTFLWRANGSPEPINTDNPFTDVKSGEYYYKAVLWAVEKGITNGTSTTTFSPNDTCTRGQIVTFQWRAANQPAPGSSINPFTDVKDTYYYYNAVLWAVEKNITNGTTPTTFSPDDFCTRGQIVTFLYRQLAK